MFTQISTTTNNATIRPNINETTYRPAPEVDVFEGVAVAAVARVGFVVVTREDVLPEGTELSGVKDATAALKELKLALVGVIMLLLLADVDAGIGGLLVYEIVTPVPIYYEIRMDSHES